MLSISSIIVPPIMLLINPAMIVNAIIRCYKSSTGMILSYLGSKLYQTQKEHNMLQEGL
jgi:hypothetical protein